MVQVSTCCGCVSLENGCYITAVIQIIIGAIEMIYKSYLAATARTLIISDDDPNWAFYQVAVASAVGSALQVIVGFLLYIGVQKKHTKCVLIWIWFMVVSLTMSLLLLIIMLVQTIGAGVAVGSMITIFVMAVVFMVLEIYLVVVVNSFYEIMKSDNALSTTTRLM